MEKPQGPRRILMKKTASCCGPANGQANAVSCCPPAAAKPPRKVTSELTLSDRMGFARCRLGSFRMKYAVEPGLYALGEPGRDSEVFVSANYRMSFDILRSSLKGMDAWILVLDTRGINVWCAAGKGTFGTDELVKRIRETGLKDIVSTRRIIVPQLGAPGVAAHEVTKETGFKVHWGPVDARDIHDYVKNGLKATKEMRTVRFGLRDRLVLAPIELRAALKYYLLFAIGVFTLYGMSAGGVSFDRALTGLPLVMLGLIAVLSGGLVTPLLLPYIPFRSFALKGLISGAALTAAAVSFLEMDAFTKIASLLFFPAVSSYMALQFTGATTYTGISGVRKELKLSLPYYISASVIALILFIMARFSPGGLS